jgi:hypothetical protein
MRNGNKWWTALGLKLLAIVFLKLFFSVELCPAEFRIFDGTLYKNKPDLSQYGIEPVNIIYESVLWEEGDKSQNLPEQHKVRHSARMARQSKHMTVIDIERWALAERWAKGHVQENISKYLTVLQWFKEEASDVLAGYYGSPPLVDYWRTIQKPTSTDYMAWQAENNRLGPIAELSDVLFPSLYAFYPEQERWVTYAIAQISEARRYRGNKPVYVFLWPMYHDSKPQYRGKYLPPDFWRLQLRTAQKHADGAVIWGGWQEKWDETSVWWRITKEFSREALLKKNSSK